MGKDSFWFRHDSNAKDDPKCILLIEQLGPEGYGIFWILIELLRDQQGYKYPIALLPSIARRYNTTLEKVKAVVNGYGLFIVEGDEFFFSASLINRMGALDEVKKVLSESGKEGALKRWGGHKVAIAPPLGSQWGSIANRVEENREELNGIEPNRKDETLEEFRRVFEDEIWKEQILMIHKGKDFDLAVKQIYGKKISQPAQFSTFNTQAWKSYLNTWLGNMKMEKKQNNRKPLI